MAERAEPEDAAMLAGAEVERPATELVAGHQPRTEPVSAEEKQALDAAIRAPH
jgi:hypothetical protein